MRLIFVSLLIANLILFIWGALFSAPQSASRASIPERYPNTDELILLSEIESGFRSAPAKISRETGEDIVDDVASSAELYPQYPESTPLAGELCELVGPFESSVDAESFVERLNAIEVSSSVENVELPAGPGYWVYLEPRSSRNEAIRLLSELHAKRIDSYVIPKGELANGISLGMFSQKTLSDARVAEMEALGLLPMVDEIERTYREVWVMLRPEEGAKMSNLTWERVMNGINMLERRQNYCLDVASQ